MTYSKHNPTSLPNISKFIHKIDSNLTSNYCGINDLSKLSHNKQNTLKLLHVNIRSTLGNIGKLNDLLISSKFEPDIISISETKLKPEEDCRVALAGYHFVRCGSPTNAGGVGLFIKSNLINDIFPTYNLNTPNCEDLWIRLSVQKKKSCIIGVVCRHPHQSLPQFISKFEKSIEMLNVNKEAYNVSEDFNVDLTKYENDSMIKNYTDMIPSLSCIP